MSAADKEKWHNWYKNILQYLKYRKESPTEELSKDALVKEMINNNLVHIKTKKICIILTYPGQKYSSIANESKKKINDVLHQDKVEELLYIADITFIGDKGVTYQASIKKMLVDFKSTNPNIWVQIRPYSIFTIDILTSTESVKHRRLEQEVIKKELEESYIPLISLPRIKEWDPQAVWIGARAGEIIAVDRLSGSVGIQTVLRRVVL